MWNPYIKIRNGAYKELAGSFPTQEDAIKFASNIVMRSFECYKDPIATYRTIKIGAHFKPKS